MLLLSSLHVWLMNIWPFCRHPDLLTFGFSSLDPRHNKAGFKEPCDDNCLETELCGPLKTQGVRWRPCPMAPGIVQYIRPKWYDAWRCQVFRTWVTEECLFLSWATIQKLAPGNYFSLQTGFKVIDSEESKLQILKYQSYAWFLQCFNTEFWKFQTSVSQTSIMTFSGCNVCLSRRAAARGLPESRDSLAGASTSQL